MARPNGPRITKICPVCEKSFDFPIYQGERKYCSEKCSQLARKGPRKEFWKTFTCPTCGEEFEDTASQKRVFCSRKCMRHSEETKNVLAEKKRGPRIPREIRVCVFSGCTSSFECIITSTRKYCSLKCHYEQQKINMRGKSLEELGHAPDCTCGPCQAKRGEMFGEHHPFFGKNLSEEHVKALSEARKGFSPSEETKEKIRKIMIIRWQDPEYQKGMSGENHPSWIDGSTIIYPPGWTEQLREFIRDRDGRICQICNKTEEDNGRKLDVHHIDSDKDNLTPYNMISLCMSCHGKTKSKKARDHWEAILTEINCVWLGT